ncbi:hypothetical protein [Cerasicoccus arenae]|uniref:Uncharacterized protein n=1 Tax=Cerasicoccus arenae TaxID=424488 RepID=A0A8J3GE61_9BACT|nr:hypothetical protein [Cerasicoccus arenae]MBK1857754.1 hypothetical protein [Cerasicoccus arenae]GHC11873.1 hypothetical protein GCM10007047_31490 [Cerasicoccus arenae]
MKFIKHPVVRGFAFVLFLGAGIAYIGVWGIRYKEKQREWVLPERTTELTFSERMFEDPESIEKVSVRVDTLVDIPAVQSEFAAIATYSDTPREAGSPDHEQMNRYVSTWDGLRDPEVSDPHSETNRQMAKNLMAKRQARLAAATPQNVEN